MRLTRQLEAVGVLAWRFGTRRALRGGTPQVGLGAAATRLMLFGGIYLSVAFNFGRMTYQMAHLSRGRVAATNVTLVGLFLMALAMAALFELAPTFQARSGMLGDPATTEALPLLFFTRLGLGILQSGGLVVLLGVTSILCLACQRLPAEWPALLALSVEYSLATLLIGTLACVAIRAFLPSHLARLTLQLMAGAAMIGWIGTVLLGTFGSRPPRLPWLSHAVSAAFSFTTLTDLLTSRPRGSYLIASGWLALAAGAALGLIWALDRRGFDRALTASPGPRRRSRTRMNGAAMERLLLRREQRVVLWWVVFGVGLGLSIFLSVRLFSLYLVSPAASRLALDAPFVVAYFGYFMAFTFSFAQANRDRKARALLASLPLTPAMTLSSKERALWPVVLPVLSWLIPPLLATHGDTELLWKSGIAAAVLGMVCFAMPAVAFLSQGGGALSALGGSARLEPLLIAIPFFGALVGSTPLPGLPSVGALALLTFEARRAASQRLRWLDDAGDELERETPAWRALLVLAAFAGLQGLTGLVFSWVSTGLTFGIAYLVSATALVLLTLNGRQGLPRLAWTGTRAWLIPVGAALGAVTGLAGIGYGKLLDRFGVDSGPLADALRDASPAVRTLLAGTIIVAAPLAEEMFFRGWLQPAIRVELPARWKRAAFVLAAFAFAAVHPGLAFPPVFLFGLLAGLLYELTGGVLAGICAHAAYNAVVMLVGS